MTSSRPQIGPLLLAELIESMPGRVRKRLDAQPDVAQGWQWEFSEGRWLVSAGEETVQLRSEDGVITRHEHLQCSCLLTPKCFHIVACISILATASQSGNEERHGEPDRESVESVLAASATEITITEPMRAAANLARSAVAAVLRVGASRTGLLVQSSVLRAAHQCRESGLVRLGNTLLRIIEGIGRLRANRETADASALSSDLASALATSHTIVTQARAPQWLVGQARRTFEPIDVRKLEGLCAEPILTLSGYAGICLYLQGSVACGEDVFTVNELRPGDSQNVLQAYAGGIDLGTATFDAKRLCRSSLVVQNLQVSSDGRLGKGKSTRWAIQSARSSGVTFREGRFALPLDEQIQSVFQRSLLPESQRRGGWDLVAFDATVIGPRGASVLVDVDQVSLPWRLTIAIDDPRLQYRENLALLARCPGLSLRCLGRLRPQAAGEVDLIAIAPSVLNIGTGRSNGTQPEMMLPPQWEGMCNVGLDRLERHHFAGIERWSDETPFRDAAARSGSLSDGLDPLRRRLDGVALGGRMAVPALGSSTHSREQRRFQQSYQPTAAQLLEVLAIAAGRAQAETREGWGSTGDHSCMLEDAYLACSSYLQAARVHFEKSVWLRGFAL